MRRWSYRRGESIQARCPLDVLRAWLRSFSPIVGRWVERPFGAAARSPIYWCDCWDLAASVVSCCVRWRSWSEGKATAQQTNQLHELELGMRESNEHPLRR